MFFGLFVPDCTFALDFHRCFVLLVVHEAVADDEVVSGSSFFLDSLFALV